MRVFRIIGLGRGLPFGPGLGRSLPFGLGQGRGGWALAAVLVLLGPTDGVHEPLHFSMGREYEQVVRAEEVFSFPGKDSMLYHRMQLLYDGSDRPLLFFSDILTPVCIDNICKPMAIQVYWNLVGAYVGYGIYPEEPLTKYDHDLFEEADYAKLHELLRNPHSVLERRALSDLFDPEAEARSPASEAPEVERVTYDGQEVDAVTGATRREIVESVVEGALYSCYTIWHLAHGEVVGQMGSHLDSLYGPELADYFLASPYADYQMYALKRLEGPEWGRNLPRLVELFLEAPPLTRRYVLKKLPDDLWSAGTITRSWYGRFEQLDPNSKTLLIEQLEEAGPAATRLLAGAVRGMSRNQLRGYLAWLERDPRWREDATVQEHLARAAADGDYPYGYLIAAYLEGAG